MTEQVFALEYLSEDGDLVVVYIHPNGRTESLFSHYTNDESSWTIDNTKGQLSVVLLSENSDDKTWFQRIGDFESNDGGPIYADIADVLKNPNLYSTLLELCVGKTEKEKKA